MCVDIAVATSVECLGSPEEEALPVSVQGATNNMLFVVCILLHI